MNGEKDAECKDRSSIFTELLDGAFFLFRCDGVAGNSLRNSLHDACRAVLSRKSHRDSLEILCAQKIVG